jgi:hypothetical protein
MFQMRWDIVISKDTAQPEVVAEGVGVYKAGDVMSNVSNGVQVGSDVKDAFNGVDGAARNAANGTATLIINQVIGAKIDNAISGQATKTIITATADQMIEQNKN